MYKTIVALVLLIPMFENLYAQKQIYEYRPLFSIGIALDHISIPGNSKYAPRRSKYSSPGLHMGWGVQSGIRVPLNSNNERPGRLYQGFYLGYFHNVGLQHGIKLFTESAWVYSGREITCYAGELGIGLGAVVVLSPQGAYQIRNGTIVNRGKPRIQGMLSLGGGIGINHFTENKTQFAQAIGYHFWIQGPYIKGKVPALPHQNYSLTSSFNLKK